MKQPINKAKTKPGKSEKVPLKKPKKAPESKEKSEIRKMYEKYLKSDQFKEVKEIVKERAGYKCEFCGRTAEECEKSRTQLQTHHSCYTHLGCGGEIEAADCRCLCGICHRGAHSAKGNLRRFVDKSAIKDNWKGKQ